MSFKKYCNYFLFLHNVGKFERLLTLIRLTAFPHTFTSIFLPCGKRNLILNLLRTFAIYFAASNLLFSKLLTRPFYLMLNTDWKNLPIISRNFAALLPWASDRMCSLILFAAWVRKSVTTPSSQSRLFSFKFFSWYSLNAFSNNNRNLSASMISSVSSMMSF